MLFDRAQPGESGSLPPGQLAYRKSHLLQLVVGLAVVLLLTAGSVVMLLSVFDVATKH